MCACVYTYMEGTDGTSVRRARTRCVISFLESARGESQEPMIAKSFSFFALVYSSSRYACYYEVKMPARVYI